MLNYKTTDMKKALLLACIAVLGLSTLHGQGRFQAGGNLGLPIGDAGDLATFAIALDLAYILEIDDNIKAGPTVQYSHSFGDDVNIGGFSISVDDVQFLPIGGRAQFDITDQFLARAELGYAIGISDGNDGGFYYSPQAAYSVSETVDIVLAFRGISEDGGSWDMITLGASFWID